MIFEKYYNIWSSYVKLMQTQTKILSVLVGVVMMLGLAVVPSLDYGSAIAQEAKPTDPKTPKAPKTPKEPKPKNVQAKVEVTIDGSAVNASELGNSTLTTSVGGHTQTKTIELENDTDTSAIKTPFNFNRLAVLPGDQFSTCFNSDILDSSCQDGTLVSAEKGKGKGQAPTKLQGTANLVLG